MHLQSCTKVAVDFVSPENLHECLKLTEDFRKLPRDHRAKEDKLEVGSSYPRNFLNEEVNQFILTGFVLGFVLNR